MDPGPSAMQRLGPLAIGTVNHCAGILRPCRAPGGDLGGESLMIWRQSDFEISETIIIDFDTHAQGSATMANILKNML